MNVSSDFKELLSTLNAARVRYVVVGAYAVIQHTEPRFTKDLDVWVDRTRVNAVRVLSALEAFGAPTDGVSVTDFCAPDVVFQIGVAPVRVDILTSVAGVRFATAYENALRTKFDGVAIRTLSLADAIRAKRASGRPQDLLDLERLQEARRTGRLSRRRRSGRTARTRGA